MEAVSFSKMPVPVSQTIQCHTQEDHNLNIYCCENLFILICNLLPGVLGTSNGEGYLLRKCLIFWWVCFVR